METILNLEKLLGPLGDVTDVNPSSAKSIRIQLRRLRDQQYDAEQKCAQRKMFGPQFEGEPEPEPADWGKLIRECQDVITDQTKDLWVAIWLTEALMARYSFSGLAAGLELIKSLVEQHWDHIQPSPNLPQDEIESASGEGGDDQAKLLEKQHAALEYTLKMVSGFNRDQERLASLPISVAGANDAPLTCATVHEVDVSLKNTLISNSLQDSEFSPRELLEGAVSSIEIFNDMCDAVIAKAQQTIPQISDMEARGLVPATAFREKLESCADIIRDCYPDAIPANDETEEHNPELAETSLESGTTFNNAGAISSRDQAFQMLEKVSQYFRKAEPHSPVSYAIEQAIRWGRMSLPELLDSLMDDSNSSNAEAKEAMFRLVGLSMGADTNDEDED